MLLGFQPVSFQLRKILGLWFSLFFFMLCASLISLMVTCTYTSRLTCTVVLPSCHLSDPFELFTPTSPHHQLLLTHTCHICMHTCHVPLTSLTHCMYAHVPLFILTVMAVPEVGLINFTTCSKLAICTVNISQSLLQVSRKTMPPIQVVRAASDHQYQCRHVVNLGSIGMHY